MNQESQLTRTLAAAQELKAAMDAAEDTTKGYRRPLGPPQSCFRLYTEAKGNLEALVRKYFPAATFFYGVGLWEGTREPSCIIEIVQDHTDAALVKLGYLAGDIKAENAQDAVLLTWTPVSAVVL